MQFFENILRNAGQINSAAELHSVIAEMFDNLADFPGWEFDAEAETAAAYELANANPDALVLAVYQYNSYLTAKNRRPRRYAPDYFQMKRLASLALAQLYPTLSERSSDTPLRVAIWVPWLPNNPNNNILRVVAGYLGGLLGKEGVDAALLITNEVSHPVDGPKIEHSRTDPLPYRKTFEDVIAEYGAPPESLHIASPPFVGGGNVASMKDFLAGFRPNAIFVPNFEMSSLHIHGFGQSAATVYLQTSVRNRPPYDFTRYLYLGERRVIDDSHIHPDKWNYHSFGYGNFGTGAGLTRGDIGLSEDAFVVVTAGNRLEREVDPEMVAVMGDLMEANSKVVWMMMGVTREDIITENLGQRFAALADRVVFKGYVREIGDYLSLSDVYANPRRTGGAVSMALAVYGRTPVLSFIGNDACNFLIDEMMQETPEAYGAKLAQLAADRTYLDAVNTRQRERFNAGHTIEASSADLAIQLAAARADWCDE